MQIIISRRKRDNFVTCYKLTMVKRIDVRNSNRQGQREKETDTLTKRKQNINFV